MDRQLNDEAIAAHNQLRAAHGCPKLTLDPELARGAQKWAEELAKTKRLQHSNDKRFGENLAYQQSSVKAALSGQQATQMWYDEIHVHQYVEQFQPQSGHFTQVIWKGTQKAGFGRASSSDGKSIYVVGRYTPPGNMVGKFCENVPRPIRPVEKLPAKKRRKRAKCVIQ
ncbi:Golgi-associated plant pathoproteinsis- protein 1 [Clonorchis sinensis]|uniref:Golgi-associated plant pathogenesis-related protein 1 n=2 Tax=Clonorchis sinensis TaxID=79923 RepID=H2KNL7_CLOSI|nr:Golgi-associated plant pathoproteinsis- protein 1 [Clonorchis sinensis]GAA42437.2 Golgi-associated plant pathogenesis-related protein 1 [Clonorchis sinensis]